MTQIEPAELSALLDGELSAARAREVEAALAADADLRAAYEALRSADAGWRSAARGAAFAPRLGKSAGARAVALAAAGALALVGLRVSQKLIDALGPALLLHGVAMAVLAAAVFWTASRSAAWEDRRPAPNN